MAAVRQSTQPVGFAKTILNAVFVSLAAGRVRFHLPGLLSAASSLRVWRSSIQPERLACLHACLDIVLLDPLCIQQCLIIYNLHHFIFCVLKYFPSACLFFFPTLCNLSSTQRYKTSITTILAFHITAHDNEHKYFL